MLPICGSDTIEVDQCLKEGHMTCKWCGSDKQRRFTAEVAIHSPGLEGLNDPIVWVFPELFLCLNCGKAEILVLETELRVLEKSSAASAG